MRVRRSGADLNIRGEGRARIGTKGAPELRRAADYPFGPRPGMQRFDLRLRATHFVTGEDIA